MKQMANAVGTSASNYAHYENGRTSPPLAIAIKIVKELGYTDVSALLNDLFGEE